MWSLRDAVWAHTEIVCELWERFCVIWSRDAVMIEERSALICPQVCALLFVQLQHSLASGAGTDPCSHIQGGRATAGLSHQGKITQNGHWRGHTYTWPTTQCKQTDESSREVGYRLALTTKTMEVRWLITSIMHGGSFSISRLTWLGGYSVFNTALTT